jgi:hypothetical protein
MKFFSNEAARQGDDTTYDDDRARERAEADTTVPHQRAGSPWSDAPGDTRDDADARLAEQERRDDSAETDRVVDFSGASERTQDVRDDADRTVVIDSDVDRRDDTTDRMADTTPDSSDTAPTADLSDDRDKRPDDSPVDLPLDDDADKRTTTYGPDGTVTTEEEADAQPAEQDAIKDEGTFDSPTVVEPATGEPVAEEKVAEESKPAPTQPASGDDRFFPEGDGLADRFRDIQLRFVDSPKEATAEAATLVDEALDKLTSALKGRRDGLASNSDDTEKLRVELRGYRELLNRVLGL